MNDDAEVLDAVDELRQQWISCHLYYHEDLNRVVRGFVQPVVLALLAAVQIDAFFLKNLLLVETTLGCRVSVS